MFIYRGRGVGERSCSLMAINWPLNGWLKKNGENLWKEWEMKGFAEDGSGYEQCTLRNFVRCKISQPAKFRRFQKPLLPTCYNTCKK